MDLGSRVMPEQQQLGSYKQFMKNKKWKYIGADTEAGINVDKIIQDYAHNWQIQRMASVDRCVLRLASHEILIMPETPLNVIIDEAIELAKKFSTQDSGRFINGVLDRLKAERDKPEA